MRRNIIILISSLFIASPVYAQNISREEASKIIQLCDLRADGARTTMRLRQMGVSLERSLEIADSTSDPRVTRESINREKEMIRRAYEVPIQRSDRKKLEAQSNFSKMIKDECVQHYLGG